MCEVNEFQTLISEMEKKERQFLDAEKARQAVAAEARRKADAIVVQYLKDAIASSIEQLYEDRLTRLHIQLSSDVCIRHVDAIKDSLKSLSLWIGVYQGDDDNDVRCVMLELRRFHDIDGGPLSWVKKCGVTDICTEKMWGNK